MVRIPGVCNFGGDTTVLCHIRRGGVGGLGLKPVDICATLACSSCHDVIDGRRKKPEHVVEHLDTLILEGICRTLDYWVKNGLA